MNLSKKIALRISRTSFVKKALEEKADLSAFSKKPSPRILMGIFLMGLSYLLGWPAVSTIGIIAIMWKEPLIAVFGCPAMYGFSHLVFLAGFYLAGAKYSVIFARWAVRMTIEKILGASDHPTEQDIEANNC